MRVTTIGSATIDIIVSTSNTPPRPGAKQEAEHIGFYPGGGAINTALSFAELGASVKIVCAVGCDTAGHWLKQTLLAHKVDSTAMAFIEGQATGKAVVQLDHSGEVSVLAQRGANTLLSLTDASLALSTTDLIYISAVSAQTMDSIAVALDDNRDHHRTTVAFNPTIAHLQEQNPAFLRLLARSDILCLNAVEAHTLAQDSAQQMTGPLSARAAEQLIERLPLRPAQRVLLTLGPKGAVYFDGKNYAFNTPAQVPVVSTLGAGDAFASSFVYQLCQGDSATQAFKIATDKTRSILGRLSANHASELMSRAVKG